MDINGRTIWQQAAGDTDRSYASLCLDWDVILNGPGSSGAWPSCEVLLRNGGWSAKKLTDLRRFCDEVKDGDLVVLRVGTSKAVGVGEVVGSYQHREEFGDVDGWDLQHVRRVRWLWKVGDTPKKFDTYAMKLGDTTQKLDSEEVEGWLDSLDVPAEAWTRPLREMPGHSEDHEISADDIPEFLFDQGIASSSINALVGQIDELIRIAKWYSRTKRPSEHETVAYLVVPLLRALGWTPQKMAVEWKRLDIALFGELPRQDQTVRAVVEAKKLGQSCLTALSQGLRYAEGKRECRRFIVTDGIRYGVYSVEANGKADLYAYLNLTRLRSSYPIHRCRGARHALMAMAPDGDTVFK